MTYYDCDYDSHMIMIHIKLQLTLDYNSCYIVIYIA
jgi:hypothetical protein